LILLLSQQGQVSFSGIAVKTATTLQGLVSEAKHGGSTVEKK